MSRTYTTLSREAYSYLIGLIKNLANVSEGIDDLHLLSNGTFSSVKIDTLLNTLKADCNQYTDTLVANLARLELKLVTNESDISQPNIMYLYKPDGQTSYNQYVVIEGTKVLLGTCDVEMSNYLKVSDAANKYTLKTDYDTLATDYDTHKKDTDIHTTADEKASYALKVDITDTIDSTSTSDKMASAKAVFDNAIKDKNLNTYSDVTQLGLTTPITVGEIFTTLPNNSLLRVQNNNGTISDAPYANGILIIDKVNQSKFSIEFKISAGGSIGDNGLYIGQLQGSDGSGLTWRRVCTTSSVKNVSWTTISESTLTNTTFVPGGNCSYSIENGECFIRFNGLTTSSGVYITAPDETFPKPNPKITNGHYPLITSNGSAVLCVISSSGGLSIKVTSSIGDIYTTISYPVAEE